VPVAVSVAPLADLAERIGGERVAVVAVMIPPGTSPETYTPSPRQVVAASQAAIYLAVGDPHFLLESRHVLPLLAGREDVRVLSLAAEGGGDPLAHPTHGGGGRGGDGEAEDDPHLWVDPERMGAVARALARVLSEIDPARAPVYAERLGAFLGELAELDGWARQLLAGRRGSVFLVQHPAWGHLARHYGLVQEAIEEGHKLPSPARLVRRIEEARRRGFPVVFVQPGQPTRSAEIVAAEIGARLVVLDPLTRDWLANTRQVIRALAGGLADG